MKPRWKKRSEGWFFESATHTWGRVTIEPSMIRNSTWYITHGPSGRDGATYSLDRAKRWVESSVTSFRAQLKNVRRIEKAARKPVVP